MAVTAASRSSGWWSAPMSPVSPLVCSSSCSTVTPAAGPPNPGTRSPARSVSASLPSSTRANTAAAVNALLTEPMANTVSTVFGVPVAASAVPYAARQSGSPPVETATVPLKPASAQAVNASSSSGAHAGVTSGAPPAWPPPGVSVSSVHPATGAAKAAQVATVARSRCMRRT